MGIIKRKESFYGSHIINNNREKMAHPNCDDVYINMEKYNYKFNPIIYPIINIGLSIVAQTI